MLIYSHLTPDILVASFNNKTQVKNSSYCGLIDDTFPDDVMSLTGSDLIINEPPGTLNLDIALAIAFNSIRDCDTARHFAKILIINGPKIDTCTLMYYVNRILAGPYKDCVQLFSQVNFEAAREGYTGANFIGEQRNLGGGNIRNNATREYHQETIGTNELVDVDFVSLLKNFIGDCLNGPCDYFSSMDSSYGFLTNGGPNVITTPGYTDNVGPSLLDRETFGKIPPLFQKMSITLSQIADNTVKTVKSVFNTEERVAAEKQILDSQTVTATPLLSGAPPTNSIGFDLLFKPNFASLFGFAKANTQVQAVMASNLGDCFRINDYRRRYNPFSYLQDGGMNGELAADPGISGMPVGFKQLNNGILNADAPDLPTGGGLDTNNPLLPQINN